MFTTTQSSLKESLSFLVYGKSGAGKTTLASTMPDLTKTCIISLENGLRSVADKNIAVYDVTVDANGKDLERHVRHDKFLHALKVFQEPKQKETFSYLIIDSLTEIAQNLVEKLKLTYPDKKDAMKLWGDYNDNMLHIVKSIRDLRPYTTLVTALDKVEVDEFSRRFHGVDIAGKISSRLPAFFDEVFYLDLIEVNEKKERMLLTDNHENFLAKDRSGKLAQYEKANMTEIINKILKPTVEKTVTTKGK